LSRDTYGREIEIKIRVKEWAKNTC
jgi:hypothetical protein